MEGSLFSSFIMKLSIFNHVGLISVDLTVISVCESVRISIRFNIDSLTSIMFLITPTSFKIVYIRFCTYPSCLNTLST